eukprot:1265916-Rhodomonas_salina.1
MRTAGKSTAKLLVHMGPEVDDDRQVPDTAQPGLQAHKKLPAVLAHQVFACGQPQSLSDPRNPKHVAAEPRH